MVSFGIKTKRYTKIAMANLIVNSIPVQTGFILSRFTIKSQSIENDTLTTARMVFSRELVSFIP
jgi:hypothetical protein